MRRIVLGDKAPKKDSASFRLLFNFSSKGYQGLLVLTLLFFAVVPAVSAQDHGDFEQWSTVSLEAHATPKIVLYSAVQPRLGDNVTSMDRILIRNAIGYQVCPRVTLWQGYVWASTYQSMQADTGDFRNDTVVENRLYQQVSVEGDIGHFKVLNRTRLEERFVDDAGGVALRARHMLRLAHPLGKSKRWSLVGYDELVWNLNDTPRGPQAGFDQNRLFLGVNRKLSPHLTLELGYLNNMVNLFGSSTNRMNHVLLFGLNFKY